MARLLDADYAVSSRPQGLLTHLWDTIDSLGGPWGLVAIAVGIYSFYLIVEYTIYRSRQKREAKKKR